MDGLIRQFLLACSHSLFLQFTEITCHVFTTNYYLIKKPLKYYVRLLAQIPVRQRHL